MLRHPVKALKVLMAVRLVAAHDHPAGHADARQRDRAASRRRTLFGGLRLQTEQDPEKPNPTFIPVANQAAEWIAERTGGIAQSSITEALMNVPTTAHILGGAVIAARPPSRASSTAASACSATRTCSSATARSFPPTSA